MIIDASKEDAQYLRSLINHVDDSIHDITLCYTLNEVLRCIVKEIPDVFFLNVDLLEAESKQIFDLFTEDAIAHRIVFIIRYNEAMIEVFERNNIKYILKPLKTEKLKELMERIKNIDLFSTLVSKKQVDQESHRKIVVPTQNGYEVLGVNDIKYVKAERSYSKIGMKQNDILLVSKSLRYFEDILSTRSTFFFRTHRSFLINTRYVKKIVRTTGAVLLNDDVEVPITNDKIDELVDLLNGH